MYLVLKSLAIIFSGQSCLKLAQDGCKLIFIRVSGMQNAAKFM